MELNKYFIKNNITNYLVIKDSVHTVEKYYDYLSNHCVEKNLTYWLIFIEKNNFIYVSLSTTLSNLNFNKLGHYDLKSITNYLLNDQNNLSPLDQQILNICNENWQLMGGLNYQNCNREYFNSDGINNSYNKIKFDGYILFEDIQKRICFNEELIDKFNACLKKDVSIILKTFDNDLIHLSSKYSKFSHKKIEYYLGKMSTHAIIHIPIVNIEKDLIDQLVFYKRILPVASPHDTSDSNIDFDYINFDSFQDNLTVQVIKSSKNSIDFYEYQTNIKFFKNIFIDKNNIQFSLERR